MEDFLLNDSGQSMSSQWEVPSHDFREKEDALLSDNFDATITKILSKITDGLILFETFSPPISLTCLATGHCRPSIDTRLTSD